MNVSKMSREKIAAALAARSVAQMRDAGQTIRRDLALRVWAIHPAALSKLYHEKGLR